jgi:alpha-tubulin suppressor-like RCC1 family protein
LPADLIENAAAAKLEDVSMVDRIRRSSSATTLAALGLSVFWMSACGGSTEPSAPAVTVLSSVSAGTRWSCAVSTAGAAYCWGLNTYGQLGNNSTANSSTPVAVAGSLTFASVSAGN